MRLLSDSTLDFGHFHPGGIALLEEFAGRDATQQFKDTHTNWEACLQAYEYLKIGRIVAERERDSANLGKYEVTLREAVYNIHRESPRRAKHSVYAANPLCV